MHSVHELSTQGSMLTSTSSAASILLPSLHDMPPASLVGAVCSDVLRICSESLDAKSKWKRLPKPLPQPETEASDTDSHKKSVHCDMWFKVDAINEVTTIQLRTRLPCTASECSHFFAQPATDASSDVSELGMSPLQAWNGAVKQTCVLEQLSRTTCIQQTLIHSQLSPDQLIEVITLHGRSQLQDPATRERMTVHGCTSISHSHPQQTQSATPLMTGSNVVRGAETMAHQSTGDSNASITSSSTPVGINLQSLGCLVQRAAMLSSGCLVRDVAFSPSAAASSTSSSPVKSSTVSSPQCELILILALHVSCVDAFVLDLLGERDLLQQSIDQLQQHIVSSLPHKAKSQLNQSNTQPVNNTLQPHAAVSGHSQRRQPPPAPVARPS